MEQIGSGFLQWVRVKGSMSLAPDKLDELLEDGWQVIGQHPWYPSLLLWKPDETTQELQP